MTKRLEKCDTAGGNLDARDAIAEKIEIGAHRERRIGVDPVGREQVSVTRGMDVELKEHRRRAGHSNATSNPASISISHDPRCASRSGREPRVLAAATVGLLSREPTESSAQPERCGDPAGQGGGAGLLEAAAAYGVKKAFVRRASFRKANLGRAHAVPGPHWGLDRRILLSARNLSPSLLTQRERPSPVVMSSIGMVDSAANPVVVRTRCSNPCEPCEPHRRTPHNPSSQVTWSPRNDVLSMFHVSNVSPTAANRVRAIPFFHRGNKDPELPRAMDRTAVALRVCVRLGAGVADRRGGETRETRNMSSTRSHEKLRASSKERRL